jgi:hypothetical protein
MISQIGVVRAVGLSKQASHVETPWLWFSVSAPHRKHFFIMVSPVLGARCHGVTFRPDRLANDGGSGY